MKYKPVSDEDAFCLPTWSVPSAITRRRLHVGYLVPVVLLLVVLFAGAVDIGDVYAASQAAFVPACMPSTGTTSTPAPTSTPILLPGPLPSPTPTSSPAQQLIEKKVWHYITLVFAGRCMEAYAMLSPDEQAQERYNVFIQDKEFTLLPGCWEINQDHISQPDSQIWDIGVDMVQVSCIDSSSMGYYYWHFRMLMQNGQLAIISIGLYPTAPGNP